MLYQVVLLRNSLLDEVLSSSEGGQDIKADDIISFLDNIVECSRYCSYEPCEFESICIIFSKWKTLLLELHSQLYQRKISNIPEVSKNFRSLLVLFKSQPIMECRVEVCQKEYSKFSAIMHIPTYSERKLEEENIGTLEEYPEIKNIIKADELFKKSKIEEAFNSLCGTIQIFINKKSLDCISSLLYSWALHALGNIAYVKHEHGLANVLFKKSLAVKEKIIGIPKYFLYVTKIKVVTTNLATYSNNYNATEKWNKELHDCYQEFKKNKGQIYQENSTIACNLEIAFNLYLGKSFT